MTALSPAERHLKTQIGQAIIHRYGLPGHLKPCQGCGFLPADCECACVRCGGDGCASCGWTGDRA